MPRHLHLDFETFSEIDLRDVGAFRYANDPSTEILCAAMALDGEEPTVYKREVWWYDLSEVHKEALLDPTVLVYCHNAQFEMAICIALLKKTWGIPCPDLNRFRCTMSLARRACLPAKLETLMECLGGEQQKDKRGKALIRKFCIMQPAKKPSKKNPHGLPPHRIRPEDEPEAFAELCAYCAQDVRAEQEVARRLAYFDSSPNNENYSLDAVINARGVTVNLDALRHAQKLIEEETEIVSGKFRELVGFEVTQNARLLQWLQPHFYLSTGPDNLQAETIEAILETNTEPFCPQCKGNLLTNTASDIECEGFASCSMCGGTSCSIAIHALRLKQSIAYASIKKVSKMLECAGPHDNRIRGMLGHHGATTGRWTASLVQFQNMKRPAASMAAETFKGSKVSWSEEAYRDICRGISREELEAFYGPVLEVISSCIRHFVEDTEL